MHQFYKYLTVILLLTAAVIGPVLFFIYKFSPQKRMSPGVSVPVSENGPVEERYAPDETPEKTNPVRILALGDIMLGRAVRTMYEQNGFGYLLEGASGLLEGNDFAWANLEGPVLYNAPLTPINGMRFAFATSSLRVLKGAGIGLLNLANNHGLDQGRSGLTETKKILAENSFVSMGDPAKIGPESLATTTVGELTLNFLGFNATWPTFKLDEAVGLVAQTKNLSAGPVLVMIHWGEEYESIHNLTQEKIGHALIDAGAEVVLGHHPHVVQDIESYRDKFIFYSLGNLIFDQWFSRETQEGLAVRISILENGFSYELLPYRSEKSAVLEMKGDEAGGWLKRYSEKSPLLKDKVSSGVL
ncbi:MAG: CapA family protein [Candidatus Liptonbacteria bacterium]